MNPAVPQHKKKGNSSSAGIFRLVLGLGLMGMSVWGIALSHEIVRVYVGPGALPGDSSFVNLGAWAAWSLFFGPLAIAGVVMARSALRKLGGLDQFAFWLWDRAGQPEAFLAKTKQVGGIAPGSERSDPHGLESMSTETVECLRRSATRAATILGALAGASLLSIGIFGLAYLLFSPLPYAGSSNYVILATGRFEIRLALFFGMLVILGFAILQQTFRKDNSSWLLPLRVFTHIILKRRRAGEGDRLTGQHRPDTKQHPRV